MRPYQSYICKKCKVKFNSDSSVCDSCGDDCYVGKDKNMKKEIGIFGKFLNWFLRREKQSQVDHCEAPADTQKTLLVTNTFRADIFNNIVVICKNPEDKLIEVAYYSGFSVLSVKRSQYKIFLNDGSVIHFIQKNQIDQKLRGLRILGIVSEYPKKEYSKNETDLLLCSCMGDKKKIVYFN